MSAAAGDSEPTVQLSSRRLKYAVWHDLKEFKVTGDSLRNPRVRLGPPPKEQQLDPDVGKCSCPELHSLSGPPYKQHRDAAERWEDAKAVNLSHQTLGDAYQLKNLHRILARLEEAVFITLIDNEIESLSTLTFPRCEVLSLSSNYISTFKALPKMPRLKHLILSDNLICSLSGIERLKATGIQSLSLKGNEVVLTEQYRRRVFHRLPQLEWLDEMPKLVPNDTEPPTVVERPSCRLM